MTATELDVWVEGHVQIPTPVAAPNGTPRAVVESLPSRAATGPVSGILVANGAAYRLTSTHGQRDGWSAVVPDAVRRELVGAIGVTNRNNGHLEVSVALLLRKLRLRGESVASAVLYENQKPCENGGEGCHPNLGAMLPSGTALVVFWPDPKSPYRLGEPGTPEHEQQRVGEVFYRRTEYEAGEDSPPLRTDDPSNIVDHNPGHIHPVS